MYKINIGVDTVINECAVWGSDLPDSLKLIPENQCESENDALTLASVS